MNRPSPRIIRGAAATAVLALLIAGAASGASSTPAPTGAPDRSRTHDSRGRGGDEGGNG